MKKIIFSIALFAGITFAANAQGNAAGTTTGSGDKPKAVVEVAKPDASQSGSTTTTATDTTTKNSGTATTEKKCAKKSCCKKGGESTESTCNKDKGETSACCKKKAEATATKKE